MGNVSLISGHIDEPKIPTRYENIVKKDIEEMAKFICHIQGSPCHCCGYQNSQKCQDGNSYKNCVEGVKVWLESEVDTE